LHEGYLAGNTMAMARQSSPLADPQPTAAIPVLITRPEAEGLIFAQALTDRFGDRLQPVIAPLIAPRYLAARLPDRTYAAVVFTSAHGVEGVRRLGAELPRQAWCVGRKTAAAAAAAGFMPRNADGDVASLVSAILADQPNGGILYLRGVDTSGNLLENLKSSGVDTDEIVVYVQESQPFAPRSLALFHQRLDLLIPLFSARTASLFQAALPSDCRARLHLAAISPAVARVVSALPGAALAVARSPDSQGVLGAVESLLANLPAP
jgi:uroporphyrinogen-III synthase